MILLGIIITVTGILTSVFLCTRRRFFPRCLWYVVFAVTFIVLGVIFIKGENICYCIYILVVTTVLLISDYRVYKTTNLYSVLIMVVAPLLVSYLGFLIIRPFPEIPSFVIFVTGLSERFPGEVPNLRGTLFTLYFIAFFIYLTVPANKIIQELSFELGFFQRSREGDLSEEAKTSLKAGVCIGILERGIVLTLVLVGEYTAMAFIIAAKSIIWQAKLNRKNVRTEKPPADYFLIGTLASLAMALFAGIILKVVLDC
jgi:hypothetical protein